MKTHKIRHWSKYAAFLAFLLWCWFFASWIHRIGTPIISSLVQEQINRSWHDFLSKSLNQPVSYDDFVTIEYGEDAKVRSVKIQTARINQYKSDFMRTFLAYFQESNAPTLRIPIGTLCAHPFLYGKGPAFTVEMLPCTDAVVSVKDRFTSAGINQTLHSIYLELTANITVFTPGGRLQYTFSEEVPLAQTWIIGQIPSIYPSAGLFP